MGEEERDRIEWLLSFIRRDLESLRYGELFDLRDDVLRYLLSPNAVIDEEAMLVRMREAQPVASERLESEDNWEGLRAEIEQLVDFWRADAWFKPLQVALRAGLRSLERDDQWEVFGSVEYELRAPGDPALKASLATRHAPPRWLYERQADGTVMRCYVGALPTVLLVSAADLLVPWWPQLRRCQYEPCGTWFLPKHGLQHYHDPKCSQLKRAEDFAPKRDYRKEYEQRVAPAKPTRQTRRPPASQQRCAAKTKAGKQCRRRAVPGKTMCKQHAAKGGK